MELVVALGVGSIVMSAIIGGLSMTMTQRKIVDHPIEAAALFDHMTLATAKSKNCNTNMANPIDNNTVSEAGPQNVKIDGVTVGTDLGKGIKVSKLEITVKTNGAIPLTDPPGGKRYPAYIGMQTSQVVSGNTRYSKPRSIPLHVNVDAAGKIIACNTDTSDQEVCMENGGTWDSLAPVGLNCTPTNHCLYGGSFSPAPAADGGFSNMATGSQGCPLGFTPQKSGEMDIAVKNGKYGVTNTTWPIYNCVRCGGTAAAGTPVPAPTPNGIFSQLTADAIAAYTTQMNTGNTLSSTGTSYGFTFPTPTP